MFCALSVSMPTKRWMTSWPRQRESFLMLRSRRRRFVVQDELVRSKKWEDAKNVANHTIIFMFLDFSGYPIYLQQMVLAKFHASLSNKLIVQTERELVLWVGFVAYSIFIKWSPQLFAPLDLTCRSHRGSSLPNRKQLRVCAGETVRSQWMAVFSWCTQRP